MRAHNIHFRREIRKNNMWIPLLIWSYAVVQADPSLCWCTCDIVGFAVLWLICDFDILRAQYYIL